MKEERFFVVVSEEEAKNFRDSNAGNKALKNLKEANLSVEDKAKIKTLVPLFVPMPDTWMNFVNPVLTTPLNGRPSKRKR